MYLVFFVPTISIPEHGTEPAISVAVTIENLFYLFYIMLNFLLFISHNSHIVTQYSKEMELEFVVDAVSVEHIEKMKIIQLVRLLIPCNQIPI